jgi:hypothetical protein
LSKLDAIDLSMVRMKLADPEEGKGWTDAQLDLAERLKLGATEELGAM